MIPARPWSAILHLWSAFLSASMIEVEPVSMTICMIGNAVYFFSDVYGVYPLELFFTDDRVDCFCEHDMCCDDCPDCRH